MKISKQTLAGASLSERSMRMRRSVWRSLRGKMSSGTFDKPLGHKWSQVNDMSEYETIEEARSAERPWLDESFLRELYVEKRLSSIEIAQYIGNITDAGVRYWLEKHGIERRSRSEAAMSKWAKLRDPDHLRRLADEIEDAIESQ